MANLRRVLPARAPPPPRDQNFFNFMSFFRKNIKYIRLVPPFDGLAPPTTIGPGSAPGYISLWSPIRCCSMHVIKKRTHLNIIH